MLRYLIIIYLLVSGNSRRFESVYGGCLVQADEPLEILSLLFRYVQSNQGVIDVFFFRKI
jgi:hypothetical protein